MTNEEQYTEIFNKRAMIDDQLVANQDNTERLINERKILRAEREKCSRDLERLKVAHTIQSHEQATAEARTKADQLQTEAEALKADLAKKNSEADELLAKLREASKAV